MNYKSYADLSSDIATNLHKIQPLKIDLVVGVPRSGMIPAYMVALLLNVDCIDLGSFVANRELSRGKTRKGLGLSKAWDAKRILLVDDSVDTGYSINDAVASIPEHCPCDVTRLAVYAENSRCSSVDIFLATLPWPRVFQWNIFHHAAINKTCIDIDVLSAEQNLADAAPRFRPTYQVHTIVSDKPEQHREETSAWLAAHKIPYNKLIMLGGAAARELPRQKADYYRRSDTQLFLVAEARQASEIANLAGKPVFCFEQNQMFYPDALAVAKYGKRNLIGSFAHRLKRRLQRVSLLAVAKSLISRDEKRASVPR